VLLKRESKLYRLYQLLQLVQELEQLLQEQELLLLQ
jgi:hypothetical protein